MADENTLPDDLVPVDRSLPDDLVPVAPARPLPPMVGEATEKLIESSSIGRVLDAFDMGARKGWGTEPLGNWLTKYKAFDPVNGPTGIQRAFNEGFNRPLAAILDGMIRTPIALWHGIADTIITAADEVGGPGAKRLARDIVSMPDAFMGSAGAPARYPSRLDKPQITGGTGGKLDLAVARDLGIIGEERSSLSVGTPAEAAANAIRPMDAYHGSPYSFEAFSMEKIGTGQGAQTFGYGHYLAENPKVAESYQASVGKLVTREILIDGEKIGTASSWADMSNRERAAMLLNGQSFDEALAQLSRMEQAGKTPSKDIVELREHLEKFKNKTVSILDPQSNLYQTRVHVNPDHLLDWYKPLSEQSQHIRDRMKELGITDPSLTGMQAYTEAKRLANKSPEVSAFGRKSMRAVEPDFLPAEPASRLLADAGIPGIKYLDQGSRPLSAAERAQAEVVIARNERALKEATNDLERELAQKNIEEYRAELKDRETNTRNLVIFDDSLIEITHKNGVPVERPAPRNMPAENSASRDVVKSEPPVGENIWRDNFDQFVGKLETGEQVKDLIRKAADTEGEFPAARRGEISLAHVESIAEAAGMDSKLINQRGLGRLLKNDSEVRVAMQLMLKTTDDVFEAARTYSQTKNEKDLIALQQAVMRHHMGVEQIVGLRAEWGRTGNVFQEFTEAVKDAQGLGQFLKDKEGWNVDKLKDLAGKIGQLNSRDQVARLLSEARKPGFMDKLLYYWTNALLSGPFSQIGYAVGDMFHATWEATIITPTAATIGKARRLVTGAETERVFFGETAARIYGNIAGAPDAFVAAWQAIKTDTETMLPHEIATGRKPYQNAITEQKPNTGGVSTAATLAMGAPTRVLGGMHSFFKFLAYRSEIEAWAYRQAAKQHTPGTPEFMQTQRSFRNFPEEAAMAKAVENAEKMTYTQELGPSGKAFQDWLRKTQVGRFVVPFMRIPANIFKAAQENTPLAYLNQEMRDNLRGKNGKVAQDTQAARVVAGSAFVGMGVMWALSDTLTGEGPKDPEERAKWLLTHEPNSVKINGYWVNHQRFNQFSTLLSFTADAVHGRNYIKDEEYAELIGHLVASAAATTMNSTGMKGIADLVKAVTQPKQYGAKYATNFATSFMPFSTGSGQIAGFLDPNHREVKTLLDAAKNRIPVLRETLYPVRDWKGLPVANSREDWGAFMATRKVNADPIDMEMVRLGIKPAKPLDRIHDVKLTPGQYDEYQSTAGALTQQMLGALISQKGWGDMNVFSQEKAIRGVIEGARETAQTAIQMRYPELIQKGVDDRLNVLQGFQRQHKKETDNPIDNLGGAQ